MTPLTDAAQTDRKPQVPALCFTLHGQPAGARGEMAACSFHQTNNIIAFEGGALTLLSADRIERAEIIGEKGTHRSRFLHGQVDTSPGRTLAPPCRPAN